MSTIGTGLNPVTMNNTAHQVQAQQQQPPQVQQNAGGQQPVQFSLPKGKISRAFTQLKNRIMNIQLPPTPFAKFDLSRTGLRGMSTSNLMWVRDKVFGDRADRQAVSIPSMKIQMNQITNLDARLDTGYQVPLSGGRHLSGYSISSDQNSTVLDTTRPVVLFLSGSGGSTEKYSGAIAESYVEQHNCNFVTLNYRGYGGSSDVPPSEESITKDGFAMINHLLQQGFQPDQIIVHGYSLGASVASRLQASVESSGYQLKGVVYDRPMSSATGAAKGYGEEDNASNAMVQTMAFGTKLTVGSISTRRNLEDIVSSQGQLRSPTVLVADTGAFGTRSTQMGTDLGIQHMGVSPNGHFAHRSAMTEISNLGQAANIL